MKRRLVVLFLIPLLASCNWADITKAEALKVVENIKTSLGSEVQFENYTRTIETAADEKTTMSSYIYSRTAKFYHAYSIIADEYRVNEDWKFVKNVLIEYYELDEEKDEKKVVSTENKDYIVDVVRNIGEQNVNDLSKQYTVTYEEYSEEAWAKYASAYENTLLTLHNDTLTHISALIESDSTQLKLESNNDNSLHIVSTSKEEQSQAKYETEIKDNLITTIVNATDTSSVTNKITYSAGDIYYPDTVYKIEIQVENQ